MKKKTSIVLLVVTLVAVGYSLSHLTKGFLEPKQSQVALERGCLEPILNKMKEDVQRDMDRQEVKDISLYYLDLKSGAWIAINKDEKFNIASLIKVPVMIGCLEAAESHPGMLDGKHTFSSATDWNVQQNIKPKEALELGKAYSLDDVLFRMIAYSDNNAMQMVLKDFPDEDVFQLFTKHKIDFEKAPDGIKMSVDSVSWFFEALYQKSLLNGPMSEKALSYLKAEDFPQGMRAAIPSGIAVESKFGEKVELDAHGAVADTQLHEVGIVQNGSRPFLIGVMTKGTNLPALEKVIRDITRDVYDASKPIKDMDASQPNCLHVSCHT
jgi:beta-lactamase class A